MQLQRVFTRPRPRLPLPALPGRPVPLVFNEPEEGLLLGLTWLCPPCRVEQCNVI